MNDISQSPYQEENMNTEEVRILKLIVENFDNFPITTRQKIENFTNWVRHRDLARFLAKGELYKSILNIPGVIFECGVLFGGGLSTWLHLGEIYEPVNYGRRVFGFDTFSGFPDVSEIDIPKNTKHPELYKAGTYNASIAEDMIYEIFSLVDKTRKISQIPRMRMIKGDVRETVPKVLDEDKSIMISLLSLDLDLYEPTKAVIEACLPRMSKGSVICFDELCYEDWPGETNAMLDSFININSVTIERLPHVPNICVIRI